MAKEPSTLKSKIIPVLIGIVLVVGFFAYGPRWAWKGSHGTPFENAAGLNASPLPVEAKFVVPEGVETVRPILSAPGGSEVEFFDVTFEKE